MDAVRDNGALDTRSDAAEADDHAPAPWPANARAPRFVRGAWGSFPDGDLRARPFRLPMLTYRSPRPTLDVDPHGQVWLANAAIARTTTYDGREALPLFTLLDVDGRVVAQPSARAVWVTWIETDADGATLALRSSGAAEPATLAGVGVPFDSVTSVALLRVDRVGAVRWVSVLPGVARVQGVRRDLGRTAVVVETRASTTLAGRPLDASTLARVELDERGALVAAQRLGTARGELIRARPAPDGGAWTFERGAADTAVSRYDASGALRWRIEGSGGRAVFDAAFDEEGRSWVVWRNEVTGVDADGQTRWRTGIFTAGATVNVGSTRWEHGDHELHLRRDWLALHAPKRSTTQYLGAPTDCAGASGTTSYLSVSRLDLQGHVMGDLDELWDNVRVVAWAEGRVCAIHEAPATSGEDLRDERPASLACDGLGAPGACAASELCASCGADLQRDDANCGACGRGCAPIAGTVGRCQQGVCRMDRCDELHADCDGLAVTGCEADLRGSEQHCGACDNPCPTGVSCADGRCQGARATWTSDGRDGVFAPTRDVVLPSGTYRFQRVTIPAGVTVRTTAEGVLDLRAVGDVHIAGVIDVSGGNGQNAGADASGGSTAGGDASTAGGAGSGPAGGGGARAPQGRGPAPGAAGPQVQTPPAGSSCAPAPDGCARHAPVLGEDPLYDGVSQTECSQCRGVGDPGARFCERYITRGAGGGGSIGLRALRDLAVASTFTPGSGGGASGMPGGAAGGAGGGGAAHHVRESRGP